MTMATSNVHPARPAVKSNEPLNSFGSTHRWLLCIVLLSSVAMAKCQEFEIEGQMTYTMFGHGALPGAQKWPLVFTNDFAVAVSGCSCMLSVHQGEGNRYVADFDGQALYQFFIMPQKGGYTCLIGTNGIPPDDGRGLNYLWLAYASGCYFSALETNRLSPIWIQDDPDLVKNGFTVRGFWNIQKTLPLLPLQVCFLSDGVERTVSADRKKHLEWHYPSPFDRGFTNASYSVFETQAVGGLMLPSRFRFSRYYIYGKQLEILNMTEGVALRLREGTKVHIFRPQFDGTAFVLDDRLAGVDRRVSPINYFVTNGNWRSISEVSVLFSNKLSKIVR